MQDMTAPGGTAFLFLFPAQMQRRELMMHFMHVACKYRNVVTKRKYYVKTIFS